MIPTVQYNPPSQYKAWPAVRAVGVTLTIIGIVAGMLALSGQLSAFPQVASGWFRSINWGYVIAGAAPLIPLSAGAGVIIHRIINDPELGKFKGSSHWVSATSIRGAGYVDTSTLQDGSGEAYFYAHKPCVGDYYVSSAIVGLTPLHVVASIAYHTLRMVFIPLYVAGGITLKREGFEWQQIPEQLKLSFTQIVKAPFYGLAQMYAALYSFVDPLGGRKLGTRIELEWNRGVPRSEAWWSVGGPQKHFKIEGGGGAGLRQTAFYAAGCWTPMGIVTYDQGKVTEATTMTGTKDEDLKESVQRGSQVGVA